MMVKLTNPRWRKVAVATVACSFLAAFAVGFPFSGPGSSLLAQTSDAVGRFVERSPGERSATDILKGKFLKGKSLLDRLAGGSGENDDEPQQRALGKIFDTPVDEALGQLTDEPLGPLAFGDPPGGVVPVSEIAGLPRTASSGGTAGGFPGGISSIVPPGTPGAGPTDPDVPGAVDPDPEVIPPAPTQPPVAAVPEPESWALMLLGFALCGAALRRRPRRPSAACSDQCVRA